MQTNSMYENMAANIWDTARGGPPPLESNSIANNTKTLTCSVIV